ncbi:type 1 glutamine amidotransferase domain-containing protein [Lentisphaera profundi]|uniref:Type 1 glutamine amidotransferase domain-containing protein n=1 Tax=Lentisphaera profundi TaxID=1658616 RepID=A0ABY7VPJ9_9BACT|nr:type 1 glutamine amidotransferase domain-containing protein [Lentisphaera profundi]WDE95912.1 type 1 glutamine amidotransferase domain-containing protein [Lentisphaera profundi]
MNVLFVMTSHDQLGDTGRKTGLWAEEFAAPYYLLLDAGVKITLASPKGGQIPIDPSSTVVDAQTDATLRLDKDEKTLKILANSCLLSEVKSSDFDAVFYPGGHGPLWDLTNDKKSIQLIEDFLQEGKPVATVCHATAVLLKVSKNDGTSFVKDCKLTGFSNSEEAAVGLSDIVPFLLEDELLAKGAKYEKREDWSSFTLQDGQLITGQNPGSSIAVAKLLLKKLEAK